MEARALKNCSVGLTMNGTIQSKAEQNENFMSDACG